LAEEPSINIVFHAWHRGLRLEKPPLARTKDASISSVCLSTGEDKSQAGVKPLDDGTANVPTSSASERRKTACMYVSMYVPVRKYKKSGFGHTHNREEKTNQGLRFAQWRKDHQVGTTTHRKEDNTYHPVAEGVANKRDLWVLFAESPTCSPPLPTLFFSPLFALLFFRSRIMSLHDWGLGSGVTEVENIGPRTCNY
jgi:hypothetical protein